MLTWYLLTGHCAGAKNYRKYYSKQTDTDIDEFQYLQNKNIIGQNKDWILSSLAFISFDS
jgi:hypothetical protein